VSSVVVSRIVLAVVLSLHRFTASSLLSLALFSATFFHCSYAFPAIHFKLSLGAEGASKQVFDISEIAAELKALKDALAVPAPTTSAGNDQPDEPQPVDPRLESLVEYMPAGASDQDQATIRKYQEHASTLVDQSARLIAEPTTDKDLATMIRSTLAGFELSKPIVEGTERTYDLAFYDIKCCGEVVTHPHLRVMSFRAEHYAKCVSGFIRANLPADADALEKDNFPDSAMVVAFDAGKHQGAETQMYVATI